MVTLSCIRKEFENIHGKLKLIFLTDMCPTQGRSQGSLRRCQREPCRAVPPCPAPFSKQAVGGPRTWRQPAPAPPCCPLTRKMFEQDTSSLLGHRKPNMEHRWACLKGTLFLEPPGDKPLALVISVVRLFLALVHTAPWAPWRERVPVSPFSPAVPAKRLRSSHIISLCHHARAPLPASRYLSCQNTICPDVPRPGACLSCHDVWGWGLAAPRGPLILFSLQGGILPSILPLSSSSRWWPLLPGWAGAALTADAGFISPASHCGSAGSAAWGMRLLGSVMEVFLGSGRGR